MNTWLAERSFLEIPYERINKKMNSSRTNPTTWRRPMLSYLCNCLPVRETKQTATIFSEYICISFWFVIYIRTQKTPCYLASASLLRDVWLRVLVKDKGRKAREESKGQLIRVNMNWIIGKRKDFRLDNRKDRNRKAKGLMR